MKLGHMNKFKEDLKSFHKMLASFDKKKKIIEETVSQKEIDDIIYNRSKPLILQIFYDKGVISKKIPSAHIRDNHYYKLFEFDVASSDYKYLRRVYSMIKSFTRANAEEIIRHVKEHRAHLRCKMWDEVLDPHIVKWAYEQLDKLSDGRDCVDNYRAAKFGNTSQMRRYKRYLNSGCCGFFDTIVDGPGGKYILGFNYGH